MVDEIEISKNKKVPIGQFIKDILPGLGLGASVYAATFAQFHPLTAALYTGASVYFNYISEANKKAIINELKYQLRNQTLHNLIHSEDFARATQMTFKAASETFSKKKTLAFARLLGKTFAGGCVEDLDIFERFHKILVGFLSKKSFY